MSSHNHNDSDSHDGEDHHDHDHEDFVDALCLTVFQDSLLGACADGRIMQWDLPTIDDREGDCGSGRVFAAFVNPLQKLAVHCLGVLHDRWVLSGWEDGNIRVWNEAGVFISCFVMTQGGPSISDDDEGTVAVSAMLIDNQTNSLFCGDYGGRLALFHLADNENSFKAPEKCVGPVKAHLATVFTILRHGDVLFTGGGDNFIMIWDAVALNEVGRIDTGQLIINSLVIWKNTLVCASIGPILRYDLMKNSHKLVGEMVGHVDWVNCLHLVGGLLVSGGSDGQLRIWKEDAEKPGVACVWQRTFQPDWVLSVTHRGSSLFLSNRVMSNKEEPTVSRIELPTNLS